MESLEKRVESFFRQQEQDQEEAEYRGVAPSQMHEESFGGSGRGDGLIRMRREYRLLTRDVQSRGFDSIEEFRAQSTRDREIAARIKSL